MNDFILRDTKELNSRDVFKLYDDVGWNSYTCDLDILMKGIEQSLKVVTVWKDDELIGIIRVVGDGCSIIYIQDILVLNDYQRKGIGRMLINYILNYYSEVRQKVLLTDDTEKNILFYKKAGFSMAGNFGCVGLVKFEFTA